MTNILVIGDSHCLVWKYIHDNNFLPGYNFIVKHVNGATSQGINNPNSKTNALPIFQRVIEDNCNADYIMISLGEVDCGFTIWYYSDQYRIPVDEQLHRSLNAYEKFIRNTVLATFNSDQVILLSSILPTIEDQTDKKLLAGARSKVSTGIVERTELTIQYNQMLHDIANNYSLHFIDVTNDLLDKSSGIINSKFRHKIRHNHHLDHEKSSQLWVKHFQLLMNDKKT